MTKPQPQHPARRAGTSRVLANIATVAAAAMLASLFYFAFSADLTGSSSVVAAGVASLGLAVLAAIRLPGLLGAGDLTPARPVFTPHAAEVIFALEGVAIDPSRIVAAPLRHVASPAAAVANAKEAA